MCMVISTNGSWNGYSMGARAERYEPTAQLPSRYQRQRHNAKIRPPRREERMRAMAFQRGRPVRCVKHSNSNQPYDPKKCAACKRAANRMIEVRDWMVTNGELMIDKTACQ